jgi:endonuclease III
MKQPFDIDEMARRIEAAVRPYSKAAMVELADMGLTSSFEQLVACIISIRTYDEVSLIAAQCLLARARAAAEMATLDTTEIDPLIHSSTFHERKAVQIRKIAQQVVDHYGGELPRDRNLILSFRGVGPKCANLA